MREKRGEKKTANINRKNSYFYYYYSSNLRAHGVCDYGTLPVM